MYKYYSGHAEEGSADEVDFKTKPLLHAVIFFKHFILFYLFVILKLCFPILDEYNKITIYMLYDYVLYIHL